KEGTRVYKMSSEKPAFYTVVLYDMDNNEKWEYIDCCINSFSIKLEMGGYVTGEVDIIGKTYTILTGAVVEDATTERGKSLLALHSEVTVDGVEKTASVESLDITIDNGLEGKGALNSQYTVKIRRSNPQQTTVNMSMNEYDKTLYASMKTKMTANSSTTGVVVLGDSSGAGDVVIDIIKMFVSDNKRGDYKGSGTHDVSFEVSADNTDKTHLKFTFEA
ncbi:MAG: phage tail tube protein, partial [Anaerovoracaceae bacterium]